MAEQQIPLLVGLQIQLTIQALLPKQRGNVDVHADKVVPIMMENRIGYKKQFAHHQLLMPVQIKQKIVQQLV